MEILKIIKEHAGREGHSFIVIGGHALNAHGISRTTGDLDLMVARADCAFWEQLLSTLGYTIFKKTSAFIQSKAPSITAWSIDLMLVDDSTISKALQGAIQFNHGDVIVPTASVSHLIAMKLHTLKSNQEHRVQKDLGDLIELIKIKGLQLESPEFRQLCLKYGSVDVYERILSLGKK